MCKFVRKQLKSVVISMKLSVGAWTVKQDGPPNILSYNGGVCLYYWPHSVKSATTNLPRSLYVTSAVQLLWWPRSLAMWTE